ncbi:hypothetical protein [Amycolatopsis sp. H20-H5]|uniref:hypothetical protein n=1 Tax=Amycolatopsis sp. H20-H5 TaxID=3046309 RepID=UPI002DBEC06F|nr:hypothetical protein [Amycolatopsis sp. H20-H5]MEC3975453.1 hypothetical protein [Amycolatopsis sp. H20-H5]
MTNAAKHAPGQPVELRLEFETEVVRLRVRNELPGGAGRLPGEAGFGLTGMGERLALAGGSLTSGRDGSCWWLTAEVRA